MILPRVDVVEAPLQDEPLGAVALVVEHDHRHREASADDRGKLHARHLKGAVADERHHLQLGAGHLGAERRWHGESHRGVVGGRDVFRLTADHQFARCEERIAHVGDDDRAVVERLIEPANEPPRGDRRIGLEHVRPTGRGRSWRQLPRRPAGLGRNQRPDEVAQQHVIKIMVADPQFVATGKDAVPGIELRGEDAKIDVGEDRAQQDHAVALLHELGHVAAAHRALVEPDEERVHLADDALGEHGGGDRDARHLGQR